MVLDSYENKCAENLIINTEKKLKLQNINFEDFLSAIKKYGYKGDLNEQHLIAVSSDINIDFDEMKKNIQSIQYIFYYN